MPRINVTVGRIRTSGRGGREEARKRRRRKVAVLLLDKGILDPGLEGSGVV